MHCGGLPPPHPRTGMRSPAIVMAMSSTWHGIVDHTYLLLSTVCLMERLTLNLLNRSSIVGGCRLRTPTGACIRPLSKHLFFPAHSRADNSTTYHTVLVQTPIICSATCNLSGAAARAAPLVHTIAHVHQHLICTQHASE